MSTNISPNFFKIAAFQNSCPNVFQNQDTISLADVGFERPTLPVVADNNNIDVLNNLMQSQLEPELLHSQYQSQTLESQMSEEAVIQTLPFIEQLEREKSEPIAKDNIEDPENLELKL
ncbi:unnamed protein product [Microthlaspi erraticum]|uniref:Uncharacterized protein n=1 Tax=Microthlaspi erraticum TaxID=1685480 RepID=A0A6D2I0J3_9BRAS|nr:unnamed protein product [Microthlaspi erraticum]